MIPLTTFETIIESINQIKSFKKGYVTNFFKTEKDIKSYITRSKIFYTLGSESFFLLIENDSFYNLFFISTSNSQLSKDLSTFKKLINYKPIVVDIVTKDIFSSEKQVFEENDYENYTTLVRMSRLKYDPDIQTELNPNVILAKSEQIEEVFGLLYTNFDQKAEQLPDKVQVLEWINNNCIYTYMHESKIIGFIIFEIIGITLYLRYWFVNPGFRDRKIGSVLFSYFLHSGKETKRQLFWVLQSNENAIKRYKHFGFEAEKMFNYVMINKK
jgi:ribosomal protein S18 acetylase RimI-like enzyme